MRQNIDFQVIDFVSYNRKSSEQDERQALSIESQIESNERLARDNRIKLRKNDVIFESKSAKKSGTRKEFNEIIKKIETNKIQGIIAWSPDRLSRNAGDAGKLVDLMDEEKLKCIITQQQIFANTPSDKFFFSLLCSQAKMENDNKGECVKRGLVKKRKKGHPPCMAKVGYMNDKGEKGYRRAMVDLDRYDAVKQLLEMFLTEKYSVRELHKLAVGKFGLTTIQRKKIGGKPIALSAFYKMLQDPYYAGFFFGKDDDENIVRYEVDEAVPRMITEQQHRQIIKLLKRKKNPRSWIYTNDFPYKKFMSCGFCGGSITAEKKTQIICGNCKKKFSLLNKTTCPYCGIDLKEGEAGKVLIYIYYHCCKKKDPDCPAGSVSEQYVESRIQEEIVNQMAISNALKEWCTNSIVVLEHKERKNEKMIHDNWYKQLDDLEKQREQLKISHLKGLYDETEFVEQKDRIDAEEANIKSKLGLNEDGELDIKSLDRKFDILTEIRDIIENGTRDEKIEALSILGSNLALKDKNISISNDIFYETFKKGLLEAKTKNSRFEPEKSQADKDKTEVFASVCPTMLRGQDSNLQPID